VGQLPLCLPGHVATDNYFSSVHCVLAVLLQEHSQHAHQIV